MAHDSAHGALFSTKRLNSIIGHIAMLPSWHVYEAWILGHNRIHHAYTVRQGYDFVWQPYTAEEYAAMSPLGRLRHRFEWSWAGAGSYYVREVWLTKMMVFDPPSRWKKAISRDRAIVYAYLATFATILGVLGWAPHRHGAGDRLADRPGHGHPVPGLLLPDRLGGPRPPRAARHPLVEAPRVDQVQGPDGGHHHPAHRAAG